MLFFILKEVLLEQLVIYIVIFLAATFLLIMNGADVCMQVDES